MQYEPKDCSCNILVFRVIIYFFDILKFFCFVIEYLSDSYISIKGRQLLLYTNKIVLMLNN